MAVTTPTIFPVLLETRGPPLEPDATATSATTSGLSACRAGSYGFAMIPVEIELVVGPIAPIAGKPMATTGSPAVADSDSAFWVAEQFDSTRGCRRGLFESHGRARCVCPAKSSSAAALSSQAAQGHP